MQVVHHLLYWGHVEINLKNLEGNTAWDMLQDPRHVDNKEMRVMLHHAGAKPGSSLSKDPSDAKYLNLPKFRCLQVFQTLYAREMRKLSDEKRNALLVIATLLVTISYQAVLNPPGSIWPEDSKPETNDKIQSLNDSTTAVHKAGTAIDLKTSPFPVFLFFNTLTFFVSNAVTFLLIPSGILSELLSITLSYLWFCYVESVLLITNAPVWMALPSCIVVFCYMILLRGFSLRTTKTHVLSRLLIHIWKKFGKIE